MDRKNNNELKKELESYFPDDRFKIKHLDTVEKLDAVFNIIKTNSYNKIYIEIFKELNTVDKNFKVTKLIGGICKSDGFFLRIQESYKANSFQFDSFNKELSTFINSYNDLVAMESNEFYNSIRDINDLNKLAYANFMITFEYAFKCIIFIKKLQKNYLKLILTE